MGAKRVDRSGITGLVEWNLYSPEGYKALLEGDPLASCGDLLHAETSNLITQVGDLYYGNRAANISPLPAQVVGMQLGTGSTTASKTGAGAALGVVIANSSVATSTSYPVSDLSGSSRRIRWHCLWGEGVATQTGIREVVLHTQATSTQTAAPESATIARSVFTAPGIDKGGVDTLIVVWSHLILGA